MSGDFKPGPGEQGLNRLLKDMAALRDGGSNERLLRRLGFDKEPPTPSADEQARHDFNASLRRMVHGDPVKEDGR